MNRRTIARIGAFCGAGIVAASVAWFAQPDAVKAADHNDPPARVDGLAAAEDIGDLFAWHDDTAGTLTVALTFAGPTAPAANQTGTYDADVLYGIHIDNTGDNAANHNIWVRFAQNDLGEWGVQVTNLPGEAGPVDGAVEGAIDAPNGAKVWAGLRDDPFFFDLTGFADTLSTSSLMFDDGNDSIAGQNATAVVLEVPLSAADGGSDDIAIWATSSKI